MEIDGWWILINILIGLFMYNDAKSRKLEKPGTWFWIGLLLGLFGLLTYWYWHMRPNSKPAASQKTATRTNAVTEPIRKKSGVRAAVRKQSVTKKK